MPNVLDIAPVRALARRAAGKIRDDETSKRFEKLAIGQLLKDARNFRPASADELAGAEDWVQRAAARGEAIVVFHLQRSTTSRLHMVARRLAETCRLAAMDEGSRPKGAAIISAARAFLGTLNRASFDVIAAKAHRFARTVALWEDEREVVECCSRRVIDATDGRTWHRVTSVAELRLIGREFRNCLARTSAMSSSYGGELYHGASQFWVLRSAGGAGLIVAMATAPRATHFVEVRGPNNATIRDDHADLKILGCALGMQPNDPPPVVGPALALAAREFCQCQSCMPPPPNSGFLRTSLHRRVVPS